VSISTDLLAAAWRSLFPAERMAFIAGRRVGGTCQATSLRDVTGSIRSSGYVKACPGLLHESLLDWQATGAHVLAWIHSHPGRGIRATHPSDIDRRQDADLRQAFGAGLVGIICTEDGWLRVWGASVASMSDSSELFEGSGLQISEVRHVYKLAIR
jgi:proteasome lid subunit RPN8/RPN11